MLKGVNRQIIEINDTGNSYFEKALLFVTPGRSDTPEAELRLQAKRYLASLSPDKPQQTSLRHRHKIKLHKKIFIICASAIGVITAAAITVLNIL